MLLQASFKDGVSLRLRYVTTVLYLPSGGCEETSSCSVGSWGLFATMSSSYHRRGNTRNLWKLKEEIGRRGAVSEDQGTFGEYAGSAYVSVVGHSCSTLDWRYCSVRVACSCVD